MNLNIDCHSFSSPLFRKDHSTTITKFGTTQVNFKLSFSDYAFPEWLCSISVREKETERRARRARKEERNEKNGMKRKDRRERTAEKGKADRKAARQAQSHDRPLMHREGSRENIIEERTEGWEDARGWEEHIEEKRIGRRQKRQRTRRRRRRRMEIERERGTGGRKETDRQAGRQTATSNNKAEERSATRRLSGKWPTESKTNWIRKKSKREKVWEAERLLAGKARPMWASLLLELVAHMCWSFELA